MELKIKKKKKVISFNFITVNTTYFFLWFAAAKSKTKYLLILLIGKKSGQKNFDCRKASIFDTLGVSNVISKLEFEEQ